MKLTIITPCYNAEATLPRCLRSIYDQGVSPSLFEVIAVDDGSADTTPTILKDNAAKYSNLKVISQQNQGVSVARNAAINAASGRFAIFLDADDALSQHTLQPLIDACQRCQDDIVICQSFCGDDEHYAWSSRFDAGTSYTPLQLIEREYIRGSACGVAFRTQMLAEHNLRFVGGLHYGEDTQFVLEAMLFSRSVSFLPIPLYQVIGASDSASRTFTPQRIRKHTEGLAQLYRHIDALPAPPERVDLLCYMRYIPMSVLVADTLNTPNAGFSLLHRLDAQRFCRMQRVPQSTRFLCRKIQLLRLSFPLYYLFVKLKLRKHQLL